MARDKCTLTDTELIEKARDWISKLAKSGGREWYLRVPVDFNHDPDMIFSELCNRLESIARIRAEARAEALKEAADRAIALLRLIRMADEWDDLTDARLSAAILADEPKFEEHELYIYDNAKPLPKE